MGCLEDSPGLLLPSAPQARSPGRPAGLVLFLVSAGDLLQGISPPAPWKAKHNLGSPGSSGENSLSLSLISVLEKIGMLFTCFPNLGLVASALSSGKGRPWREQLYSCPSAPLIFLLSCSHPNCEPPIPRPAQILLNCAMAREARGVGCGWVGSISQVQSCSSSRDFIPEKLMAMFADNPTPVEMFAIFFVECYFFHIQGLISCNSWRVPGGRGGRKLSTEGSGD